MVYVRITYLYAVRDGGEIHIPAKNVTPPPSSTYICLFQSFRKGFFCYPVLKLGNVSILSLFYAGGGGTVYPTDLLMDW
jgi:hypothetical protein